MKNILKRIFRNVGLQIKRYPDQDLKSRKIALANFGINKILDIGANTGQYAMEMKNHGFDGKIISFEPLSSAYQQLEKNSSNHSNWITRNLAIGDLDGEITINISQNSQSSSILEMLPAHLKSAPESAYINTEKVKINKLDTIFHNYYEEGDRILLKIDTQGYEKNVLDGATIALTQVIGVKLEMSLVHLYKGEMLSWEMIQHIEKKGFTLFSLENTYADPKTGQLLQIDGIFYKSS